MEKAGGGTRGFSKAPAEQGDLGGQLGVWGCTGARCTGGDASLTSCPRPVAVRRDNAFFSLEGKQIFPNRVSGLRASLSRTPRSEILRWGMPEAREGGYLISRALRLAGIASRWRGGGPQRSFLGSRREEEPVQVSWGQRFCNSHAVPQGARAEAPPEVRPGPGGRVTHLMHDGLLFGAGLVGSEMRLSYSLDLRSQDEKRFVLIITADSPLFPFTQHT